MISAIFEMCRFDCENTVHIIQFDSIRCVWILDMRASELFFPFLIVFFSKINWPNENQTLSQCVRLACRIISTTQRSRTKNAGGYNDACYRKPFHPYVLGQHTYKSMDCKRNAARYQAVTVRLVPTYIIVFMSFHAVCVFHQFSSSCIFIFLDDNIAICTGIR